MEDCGRSDGADGLRTALSERGWVWAIVCGHSMVPTLRHGDLVRVAPIVDIRPGDVVVFVHRGRILQHRVLSVSGDGVLCRGDNMPSADAPVPRAAVLGKSIEVAGRGRVPDGPWALVSARRRHVWNWVRGKYAVVRGRSPAT